MALPALSLAKIGVLALAATAIGGVFYIASLSLAND